jgi:thiamine-monophosphate kinase
LKTTPIALVGRKAITRCLSDAAAMACRPIATLVAATLPPTLGERRANALFDAMRRICEQYESPLIGGDIAFHASQRDPLVISTTVLAEPIGRQAITRGGARPGDGVYVTGRLGGSLQKNGLGRHLTFEPRIREAAAILKHCRERNLHAMIDISDGLGRDASHIAEMSNVQIVLDATVIPCNRTSDWRDALHDGEDYELLFTAAGTVPSRLADVKVTRIGEVCRRRPRDSRLVIVKHNGQTLTADDLGWEHRSKSRRSR